MQGILLQRTRQQDGAVVNAVDSQQGDSWLEPSWGLSLKFSCSYAFGGFLQDFPQPKHICLHVIGGFKLVVAVRQMKCMRVPCSVQCAINAGTFTRV